MPERRQKKTALSKSKSTTRLIRPKPKTNNLVSHERVNLLTQSVGELPFRNNYIKKNLIEASTQKSISKFETSIGLTE